MKIVIIGNGVAGIFSAQNIRNLDKDVQIEIFTSEPYPYYTRVKLPELISEKLSIDDLIVFKKDWYEKNKIITHLDKNVNKIDPKNKSIIIEGENDPIFYDKLIIATGSMPAIPPIKNAKEMQGKGVFTLRNIENALEIRDYIKKKGIKNALVIGGGLLGLELAKQIKDCNLETTVVEFFPRLLPRQLDSSCSGLLKDKIEEMGIKIELDAATEEIIVIDGFVKGIKIKDGRELQGEMVLIQAGITPNVHLVKDEGIDINRGILVNHFLETTKKDIYAVGDCLEFKNQIWGIIPACIEQSKIVANSVLGKNRLKYEGTIPKNTLKIIGIDLTSIGLFDPEDKGFVGVGWQILKNIDSKKKCYKKIVLKDNILKGAILFGENEAKSYVNNHVEMEVDELELRKAINLYKWICGACGTIYDETVNELLFKNLPEDWKCPNCGSNKEAFRKQIVGSKN